jgi:Nitrogen fixation protein NifW
MLMRAIAEIENAEELFDLLGEPYQRSTLRVHRFRILKRFGREVARLEETAPLLAEEARRVHYSAALRRIHDDYVKGGVPETLALHKPPELVTLRRPIRCNSG